MINRIAVVPYPPLLVPELTVRAGAEVEQLRSACLRAASSVTEVAPEWVALGAEPSGSRVCGPETAGTFAGYGVDVPVTLGGRGGLPPDPQLPLPALMAGWLRGRSGADRVTTHLLPETAGPEECRARGARIEAAARPNPTGLLVLCDGTDRSDERSPVPPDERAAGFDARMRDALAGADPQGLTDLDAGLAGELGVRGRAALHAMVGVVSSAAGEWRSDLLYSATPLGVTYHVAVWSRGNG
ncbi:class III extradiol ring-cleavage dioxygenase family protein [Parasphingorhabdus pacifica]